MTLMLSGLLSLLLSGCVTVNEKPVDWADELPQQSYFSDYYRASGGNKSEQTEGEYLKWVTRFYEGWVLYAQGWNWLTDKVMSELEDPAARDRVRVKMAELGKLSGAEWALDGDYRVIDTGDLMVWGEAVKTSVELGKEEWLADQVLADVGLILRGRLADDAITSSRYFGERTEAGMDDLAFEDDF